MKPRYILHIFLFLMMAVFFTTCEKDEKTNTQPVIQSVTVTPNIINANGMVTIAVVASDADKDPLSYAYIVTGGAITGTGPFVSWTAPSTDGAHSVTVTVRDGKGGEVTQNASLTVLKPVTQVTGTASFVAGVSGDLSNAKVSLYTSLENFELNQPVRFVAVNGSGGNVTFTIPNVLPGNYYLSVWKDNNNSQVFDKGDFIGIYGVINLGAYTFTEMAVKEGETFNCKIDMWILDFNTPPLITSFNVFPTTLNPGQRANVSVEAIDDDNDALTYQYSVNGGFIIGTGTNVQWEAPLTPGDYNISVTVDDGNGGTDQDKRTVTVQATQTKITGSAKLEAGLSGDLVNSKVSIYKSISDWIDNIPVKFTATSGAGTSVTYILNNVTPGTYYLDLWKDNDNNGIWSAGDFVGLYDDNNGMIPFTISDGQTITINLEVTKL
ncbi:MAG: hypothetical protein IPN49_12085 [Saprospiraceae bacterium]|nr:hypothetical protein [Saprospiraceae bacterium]